MAVWRTKVSIHTLMRMIGSSKAAILLSM